MKIVAIVRTKNSIFVLDQCLTMLSSLVDEIIILDNGSTDGTLEMCAKFPKIVKLICHDDKGKFHEGRDRNLMLAEAKERNPDWIIMVDPDEVFENHLTRDILDGYLNKGYDQISFRMCNFWLSMTHCRIDRDWFKYTLTPQRHLWRNVPGMYFTDDVIHAGMRGTGSNVCVLPFRIKHYGYVNKKNIIDKISVFRNYDSEHPYKYNTADFSRRETRENIVCYRFLEFDNKLINYLYIVTFKSLCDILWDLLIIKRRYLHLRLLS